MFSTYINLRTRVGNGGASDERQWHQGSMASPIFLSNPSPGFSHISIVKGILIALSGIFFQRHVLWRDLKIREFFVTTVLISLLVRLVIEIPHLLGAIVTRLLRLINIDVDFSLILTTITDDILELRWLALVAVYCYMYDSFEYLFMTGLKKLDAESQSEPPYSEYLLRAHTIDIHTTVPSWFPKVDVTLAQKRFLVQLLRSYALICLNTAMLMGITKFGPLGIVLTALYISKWFSHMIGSQLTFVLFLVGLVVPTDFTIKSFASVNLSLLTVKSLLTMPYFQKIRLSDVKIENWIESRIGLIVGFGLFFHLASRHFNMLGLTIVLLEQLALSYMIFKTTSPVQEITDEKWILTQISCPFLFEGLQVTTLTPGFVLIKESLRYDQETPSETPSKFSTPLPSSTNLQKLSEH